jgi:hypothetical protein
LGRQTAVALAADGTHRPDVLHDFQRKEMGKIGHAGEQSLAETGAKAGQLRLVAGQRRRKELAMRAIVKTDDREIRAGPDPGFAVGLGEVLSSVLPSS